jgi:hypothetical protein
MSAVLAYPNNYVSAVKSPWNLFLRETPTESLSQDIKPAHSVSILPSKFESTQRNLGKRTMCRTKHQMPTYPVLPGVTRCGQDVRRRAPGQREFERPENLHLVRPQHKHQLQVLQVGSVCKPFRDVLLIT